MPKKHRLRFLLFLFVALVFALSQDRYAMRRLFRRGPSASVRWQTSLPEALKTAQREGRPLFVEFSASWCGPCQQMLQDTYRDPDVARRLNEQFVPVLIDIDKQPALAAQYGVDPIPDGQFLSPDGRVVGRSIGFHDSDDFLDLIDRALKAEAALPPVPEHSPALSSSAAPLAAPPLPASFGMQ